MNAQPQATLNAAQAEAVHWGRRDADGLHSPPLLVIAGAGTGKTATLAHRVAHLVNQGADPRRILLLTFSRRAAHEMTHRAGLLLTGGRGVQSLLPWSGTFHSIGARLLRRHAARLGLPAHFGVLDRADSADLIDTLREDLGLARGRSRFPRKDTCLAIYSSCVNTGRRLPEVLRETYPWCLEHETSLTRLLRTYAARKQTEGVLDYDDLLLWWEAGLDDPGLAKRMSANFDHLLVDEYQDTNHLQASILRRLRPDGRGVFVVGDDAQSIYGFRGADVENILGFERVFTSPAHRITLTVNYRSVQPILDTANALLADSVRAYPKVLRAHRGQVGAPPALVSVLDEREQADFVADQVLRLRETGIALRQQAALFRSAQHSDGLELELTRRNIPFVKHGGLRFLESAHVKDLLALLRWSGHPRHRLAGFRVLQWLPGVGPALARRWLDRIADSPAPFTHLAGLPIEQVPEAGRPHWPMLIDTLRQLAESPRWPQDLERAIACLAPLLASQHEHAAVRIADLHALARMAERFPDRDRFLTELAIDPPNASGDLAGAPHRDEDYLELSTVHSAKGREWHTVYVLNLADGSFPNEYATGSAAGIEEERRLLYVAMTRARDALYLIEPQRYYLTGQPRLGGEHVTGARSRFLSDPVMRTLACARAGDFAIDDAGPSATPPSSGQDQDPDDAPSPADPDTGDARPDIGARLIARWG